jgi:TetR/AcrR family transcriptional regulator, repressor for neighboring sulfatase
MWSVATFLEKVLECGDLRLFQHPGAVDSAPFAGRFQPLQDMKTQLAKRKRSTGAKSSGKTRRHKGNHNVPQGRAEISEAILQATEKLLPKHNPADISLRQIAEAANINYSLIHRYFGTKESVIMAAHGRILSTASEQFSAVDRIEGNIGVLFEISGKNASRRILLAQAMLDGADPHLIPHHFPIMQQLVELLRKKKSETKKPSEYDAETLAAFFAGSSLGWFFFEPFLLASTGLDKKDKDKVHGQIIEMLEKTADLLC